MSEYVQHPLIVPGSVEARTYQLALAKAALKNSSMIVLPTGLGKTVVALLVIATRLDRGGRVLFLAPTKPLVEQHAEFLRSHLCASVVVLTGEIPARKRVELWRGEAQVIVSTPQVIENDLVAERFALSRIKLIIFDEAHRAVGNYSYVYIARKYIDQAENPLIVGLTASPGGTIEKIQRVSDALHIDNIEIRTESDPDVVPYIHEKDIEWCRFSLPPEMDFIRQSLNIALSSRLRELKRMRIIRNEWTSTSELLRLRVEVGSNKNYRAMSIIAEVIKLRHAIGMIETQGVVTTNKYFERLKKEAKSKGGSKAARKLVGDPYVKRAMDRAKMLREMHPKLLAVKNVVRELFVNKPDSRIIVFTNYRDTAELVKNVLSEVDGVRPIKFVGQAQKDGVRGLSQKQQVQLLSEFVEGTYNVLVATSVAEEGLDIPSTDMVLFYEPIPSEIRSIQREGRTGRRRAGKVVVLITKGTRDEAYYWSSNRKRKIMRAEMKRMSDEASDQVDESTFRIDSKPDDLEDSSLGVKTLVYSHVSDRAIIESQCSYHCENEAKNVINDHRDAHQDELTVASEKHQKTLLDFEGASTDTVKIVVDVRELRSDVVSEMDKLGAEVEVRTLPVADYVLSDKVAIERKTAEDFLSTLIDRDPFGQIRALADSYENPILIIEGKDLYTGRNIHQNAIRGMLASIVVDFNVPILFSDNAEDTAAMLYIIARRAQAETKREPFLHGKKSTKTLKEQQEYLISSIPAIGPVTARALLTHFQSVEAIINAREEELVKVRGIGKITAQRIRDVVSAKYELGSPKT
jgi:ERCC4-related helicase/ERCC4-type nuclease